MSTVAPDRILKELEELWVTTGKQEEGEAGQGVLRACTLTLVAIAEEGDDPMALGETVAALMPEHPARTIVIRLRGGGERTLSERVYAQCWMPFGQRRQICCEQVEITASDAALEDLAEEGVSQLFKPLNGSSWIVGVVGMLQFDVIANRIENEYNLKAGFEDAPFDTARWISSDDEAALERFRETNAQALAEDRDGALVFLARNAWALGRAQQDFPAVRFSATREQP